jgi:ABC-type branched-subunit amino acid transport system substrate-binding protein
MPEARKKSDAYLLVVVEESASRVGFYDPATGDRTASIEVGFWPHEIEVSPDGRTAYVSNFGLQDYDETMGVAGYSVSILDLELMCERGRLYTFTEGGPVYRAPHAVKLRPGTDELFVNVEQGGRILVFDLPTRSLKRRFEAVPAEKSESPAGSFPDPAGTHNFVFSADGSSLYLFAGALGVYRMDPDTGALTLHYASDTAIHGLAWMPGNASLIASGVGEIVLLDPRDLSVQKTFGNLGVQQLLYSVPTSDGKRIVAPAVWDSQTIVVDAESGAVLARIVTGIDPVHVVISASGDAAWVSNARSKYCSRIDLATYALGRMETGEGPNGIAICPPHRKRARKPLVFGCVLPLSGALGQSGRELLAGYQYWAERVNGSGGLAVGGDVYEVSLALRDNASDPTQTVVLTKDVLDAGAAFMMGGYPTPSDQAAGVLVNKLGVPLVTSACAGDTIYTPTNRFVFGILSPASGYLKGTVDVVMGLTPAPATFCMLASDDAAASEDAQVNAAYAISRGMKILAPTGTLPAGVTVDAQGIIIYHEGMTDFTPILQLIAGLKPEMFLETGHAPATLAIVQQAAAINFVPDGLSFAVGPATPSVVEAAGPLAANLFGPAQWIPELPTLGYDRFGTASLFASDYYSRYNMEASYLSAGAAACGLTYEDAIQRAGSVDREAVRDALAVTKLYTFYWLIEFNAQGVNATKPLFTLQLQADAVGFTNVILEPPGNGNTLPIWPFPGWGKTNGEGVD